MARFMRRSRRQFRPRVNRFRKTFRKFRRSRRFGRKPRRTGTLPLKATTTTLVTTSTSAETVFPIVFTPGLQTEFNQFATLFEKFKASKHVVQVRPSQNNIEPVDVNQPYVIAPWHRPIVTASTVTLSNVLSLDKHKYVNAWKGVKMAFNPATVINAEAQNVANQYTFKPWIQTTPTGISLVHYCGLLVFPASTVPLGYTVKTDTYYHLMNQKTNIV